MGYQANLACEKCTESLYSSSHLKHLLSLPVAGQMYNQELQQANLVQIPGSILYKGAPPTPNTSQLSNSYYATLTPTDTSSYSDASTMRPAALIEIANNVQQHAAELQA